MTRNMSDKEEAFRTSLKNELQNTEFPLNNPMEFSAALSNGTTTVISMGDSAISASEIGVGFADQLSYPYHSTSAFVNDVVQVLKNNNEL